MGFIADAIEDVVDVVGDVVEDVGDFVGGVLENGLDNILVSVAAIASGQPWLAAAYNTTEGVISGNPLQAIGGMAGLSGFDFGSFSDFGGDIGGTIAQDIVDFGVEGASQAWGIPVEDLVMFQGDPSALATLAGGAAPGSVAGMYGNFDISSALEAGMDPNQAVYTEGLGQTARETLGNPEASLQDIQTSVGNALTNQGITGLDMSQLITENRFGDTMFGNYNVNATDQFLNNTSGFDPSSAGSSLSGNSWGSNLKAGSLESLASPTENMATSSFSGYNPDQYGDLLKDPTWAGNTQPQLEGFDSSGTDMSGFQNNNSWDNIVKTPALQTKAGMSNYGFENNPSSSINFTENTANSAGINPGSKSMWSQLGDLFKGRELTPFEKGARVVGGIDSIMKNRDAMKYMENATANARTMDAANAQRGQQANDMWTQNFSNPQAAYDQFMQGSGRQFVDQARAQAAKTGRRGSYLNSGKMNSDLASLFMQNQLQRGNALANGFSNSNSYASTATAPIMASMIRNQNAPVFDALSNVNKYADIGKTLSSLWS